jgi:hypothetical protein
VSALAGETFDEARRKLELLEEADRERVARESALNELQAFVFDLQDKIYQVKIFLSLSPPSIRVTCQFSDTEMPFFLYKSFWYGRPSFFSVDV